MGDDVCARPDGGIATDTRRNEVERKFPIVEVFGPVLQGEGALIGATTHFIRFGGCDYRCLWCDTPNAVIPELIQQAATSMTTTEIVSAITSLAPANWVTLSGGNPALFDCEDLIRRLRLELGYSIAIETQGSMFKDWFKHCDLITVSPKPPSSQMASRLNVNVLYDILRLRYNSYTKVVLKVPISDEEDLAWAKDQIVARCRYDIETYFQPVRWSTKTDNDSKLFMLGRLDWLASRVLGDPDLKNVRVLPQMHALLGMR